MTVSLYNTSAVGREKGWTPLASAAEAGDVDTVAELLAHGSSVHIDARDYDGCTSLALAAQNGQTIVVEQLLAHGANPNLRDLDQVAPLWRAARYGHASVVRLLLASKQLSDVNPRPSYLHDRSPDTPLSVAIKEGHQETAKLLAHADGIKPCLTTSPSKRLGYGPISMLGLAIRHGFEDVALALLNKCDLRRGFEDADSGDGGHDDNVIKDTIEPTSRLLVFAASAGCSKLVRELLTKHGADVNAVHRCGAGEALGWLEYSPLMAASRRGDLNLVRSLLDMDEIRPGVNSKYVGTALTAAAQEGFVDVVNVLIADGRIGIDCKNCDGRTALSLAAENACEDVVNELLATGAADLNSQDNRARTPLIWAADPVERYGPGGWQSYEGVIRALLANSHIAVNARDSKGCTALLYAAERGALGLVMALLEHPQIDPTAGPEHTSPLAEAAKNCHADVVQALLNMERVDINSVLTGVYEKTALMAVVEYGRVEHENAVQLLLSTPGIDLNFQDSDGRTALMMAVSRGKAGLGLVNLILTSGGNPNMQDHNGNTALSLASDFEVTRSLLGATGIKPDLPNNQGRTALSLAAEAAKIECVKALLASAGVNPDAQDIHGRRPLSWVFRENGLQNDWKKEERKQVLQQLLRIPAVNPNAEDHNGLTPLLLAIMSEHGNEYVEVLLSRPDLDVNRPRVSGRESPLDTAKQTGNMDTVALLRARGASESIHSVKSDCFEEKFEVLEGYLPEPYSIFEVIPPQRAISSGSHEPDFDWHTVLSEGLLENLRINLLGEHHLHLGEQQAYLDEWAESTASMCSSCLAIDLGPAFWRRHTQYGGRVIADLGRVDETWKKRKCPLCRLLATVYPRTSLEEGHKLVSFSTTQSWLCHTKMIRWDEFRRKHFLDTMLLAVVTAESMVANEVAPTWPSISLEASPSRRTKDAVKAAFSSGLIGRLGKNGPDQGSLSITQLATEISDWSVARGWITMCRENHQWGCNPPRTATIPHFFLIECSTRQIIEHKQSQAGLPPEYVALSYVWGQPLFGQQPPQRQRQQESLDEVGEGAVEAAIEDAMRVTLELGYRYLWVDRYCIVQTGNEAIKQEQLRHMHLVYANAEVTLVAAAGKDASAGLPGVPGRPRHRQPGALIQGHAVVCIPPDPTHNISSHSTWATRGWTYQEGLLARRRLYFSEYEMSYECRHMLCREAMRLPLGLEQRMSGRKPRFMEPFWMYEPYSLPGMDASHTGVGLFDLLAVYLTRQLSLPSDTLNAMLGILSLLAQHETKPIYHICGVPILHLPDPKSSSNSDTDDATAVGIGGFLDGLCWRLQEPAHRRPGFPSWSWAGWQGVVTGMNKDSYGIKQTYGLSMDISIIPGNQGAGVGVAVPWSRCYDQLRMPDDSNSEIRSGQQHVLEITASAVTVRFRTGEYEGRPNTWIGTVCAGDDIWQGEFSLTCKDEANYANLHLSSLLQKPWTGIVLGNSQSQNHGHLHDTTVLVIREQHEKRQGDLQGHTYCERIGLLSLLHCTLNGSMLERRKWRLM